MHRAFVGVALVALAVPAPAARAAEAASAGGPPRSLYAVAFQIEQGGGEPEAALALYRRAFAEAAPSDPELAARILQRIGACERTLGRVRDASVTWRRLAETYPDQQASAAAARAALRELRSEQERVSISGLVLDPQGAPAPGCVVVAGEWGFDPPLVSGPDGAFSVVRRMPESGGRPPLAAVYAEHPLLPLAGVAWASASNGVATVTVRLSPAAETAGRVADTAGKPVADARITVTALMGTAPGLPLPYDRILPPVRSGEDGRFRLAHLAAGLRLRLEAEREGYRLARGAEVAAGTPSGPGAEIVLDPLGRAALTGVVTDESGAPLAARVTALGMPPALGELATAETAADGHYELGPLPAARLIVRAESAGGYAGRSLAGVEPGRTRADFVLARGPSVRKAAAENQPAPELEITGIRPGLTRLAHARGTVVLLCFWSSQRSAAPPYVLEGWQRKYGAGGLRVVGIHDHSGSPEDLVRAADRNSLSYDLAIDRYAPTADPSAMNSATMGRYGAAPGHVALVDREGILRLAGNLDERGLAARVEAMLGALTAEGSPAAVAPRRAAPPLMAPALSLARWLRGDPLSGMPLTLAALRGRVAVLHFSSAYVDAAARHQFPRDVLPLERLAALYGPRGVTCLWVLPSAEQADEAALVALDTYPDLPIAVDRNGETYRAFGVTGYTENCVVDPEGRIHAAECSDSQLFRTVKDLLVARGLIREGGR